MVDALVSPFTGDLEKTDIWNIAAGFTHYWTPQFRTSVFGSYARVEYGGIASFVSPHVGRPEGEIVASSETGGTPEGGMA